MLLEPRHHGAVERLDATGCRSEMEGGDVGITDEPLGLRCEGLPGEPVEEPHRAVAAACADDCINIGRQHRLGEVGKAGLVAAREVACAVDQRRLMTEQKAGLGELLHARGQALARDGPGCAADIDGATGLEGRRQAPLRLRRSFGRSRHAVHSGGERLRGAYRSATAASRTVLPTATGQRFPPPPLPPPLPPPRGAPAELKKPGREEPRDSPAEPPPAAR